MNEINFFDLVLKRNLTASTIKATYNTYCTETKPTEMINHCKLQDVFGMAKLEWPNGTQRCACHTTVVGSSPKPPPMLVDTSASTWIEKARLSC